MTKKGERTKAAKRSIQRRSPNSVTDLPTGVQKSYFMLSEAERAVLNTALEKYRPGQFEPIFVGGHKVLKPALRLMTLYRLAIDEITDSHAITIYTRWVDAVHLKRGENEEVYLTFSPSLERIWLESKKRLSQNLLMTLWHISDEGTVQIMSDFYVAARESGNVPEALAMDQHTPELFTRGEICHMRIWSAG